MSSTVGRGNFIGAWIMGGWREELIRWSARVMVALFFVAISWRLAWSGETRKGQRVFAWAWIAGAVGLVVHDVLAMGLAHGWSHVNAMAHTAERTEELVGLRVGWGLYLNYLMTALWVADGLWLGLARESYFRRPGWVDAAMGTFFAFLVLNATVVFESGLGRWIGVAGFGVITAALLVGRRHARNMVRVKGTKGKRRPAIHADVEND